MMQILRKNGRKRNSSLETSEFDFGGSQAGSQMTFTYPNWQQHAEMVKRSLTNISIVRFSLKDSKKSPQKNCNEDSQKMMMGMTRFQQVHNGEIQHETIRKLQIAQFTYPRWERDVQECLEWYLQMEDIVAKEVVLNIVKKQRMHNGERSEYTSVLALLNRGGSFSYEGWKKHKRMIEDILTNSSNEVDYSFSANRKDVTRDLYKGMIRLQRIHDGKSRHSGIESLHADSNSFTYPRWSKYREEVMIHFLKFEDDEAKELCGVMKLKQDMHDGKRSNWLLTNLDAQSFTYEGCTSHARATEMALTNVFKVHLGEDRAVTAEKLLKGMLRLQKVYTGKTRHKGIENLHKTKLTYIDFGKDKKEVMECFLRFQDGHARDLQNMMLQKQRMHDGQVSGNVRVFLSAFDKVNMKAKQDKDEEHKKVNDKGDKPSTKEVNGDSLEFVSSFDYMNTEAENKYEKHEKWNNTVNKATTRQGLSPVSPRVAMRRLENKWSGKIPRPVRISHSGARESLLNTEDPEKARLSRNLFSTAKDFNIGGSGFCKPNECSDLCYLCTESKKFAGSNIDSYVCLCAQISQFDEKSSQMLDEISRNQLSSLGAA